MVLNRTMPWDGAEVRKRYADQDQSEAALSTLRWAY